MCLVTQSCPTLCDPMNCSPPGSSVHGILQERILEWAAMPSPGDLPNAGIEPRPSTFQVVQLDSLPTAPPGKPFRIIEYYNPKGSKVKVSQSCPTLYNPMGGLYSPWNSAGQHTGVRSLSLLQGISPTQGLNPGLPHCRRILYQLSHKGSPKGS